MAEDRSRTTLRTLIAISASSTTPGELLAQIVADCVRHLPGTASGEVAYIDRRVDGEKTHRQRFFLNLTWQPEAETAIVWSRCGPVVHDAVAAAITVHGGRLLSFDLVSLVLWRHLVAGADGLASSSPARSRRSPTLIRQRRGGVERGAADVRRGARALALVG